MREVWIEILNSRRDRPLGAAVRRLADLDQPVRGGNGERTAARVVEVPFGPEEKEPDAGGAADDIGGRARARPLDARSGAYGVRRDHRHRALGRVAVSSIAGRAMGLGQNESGPSETR